MAPAIAGGILIIKYVNKLTSDHLQHCIGSIISKQKLKGPTRRLPCAAPRAAGLGPRPGPRDPARPGTPGSAPWTRPFSCGAGKGPSSLAGRPAPRLGCRLENARCDAARAKYRRSGGPGARAGPGIRGSPAGTPRGPRGDPACGFASGFAAPPPKLTKNSQKTRKASPAETQKNLPKIFKKSQTTWRIFSLNGIN